MLLALKTIDLGAILRQDHMLFPVQHNKRSITLANSSQAKKRARQSEAHRCANASKRSEMRTYLKNVTKAIAEGNKALAVSLYAKAVSTVDRLVGKGIIHANKAARHKSRLNAHIKSLEDAK